MSIAEKTRKLGQSLVDAVPASAHILAPLLRAADRLQGGELHRHVQKDIDVFCTPEQKADPAYLRRLRRDMWYCSVRYLCAFNEYFLFDFQRLDHWGRMEFVPELEKVDACRALGDPAVGRVLQDKWQAYERFGEYYKREVVRADGSLSDEAFRAFIRRHPRFIVKPVDAACGRGVRFCDAAGVPDIPALLDQLQAQDVILEQPIVQCQSMAQLHPQSVNTVRCAVFTKDGQAYILFTFLRIGRGDTIVDNAGSGGFVCAVDPQTGITVTKGVTESLDRALIHPETRQKMIGWQIPRWEEMCALAKKLSLSFPDWPYISWDFALTDDGWVVVEANHAGQFVCPQFTTGQGIRRLLAPYFQLRHS